MTPPPPSDADVISGSSLCMNGSVNGGAPASRDLAWQSSPEIAARVFASAKSFFRLAKHSDDLARVRECALTSLSSSADEPECEQKSCVTIDEWIDVWGTLVGKAKKLDDFPMWLQYYPKVLFDVINRTGELN